MPQVCQEILENSFKFLSNFDKACVEAASIIFRSSGDTTKWTLKNNIHFRVVGVPPNTIRNRSTLPKVVDLWKFVSFSGYVTKITKKFAREYRKEVCCDKCKYSNVYEAKYEERYRISADCGKICQNELCKSRSFTQEVDENGLRKTYFSDYQEIKVKENPNSKSFGSMSASVFVTLEDDLVDATKVGDVVTVWYKLNNRY